MMIFCISHLEASKYLCPAALGLKWSFVHFLREELNPFSEVFPIFYFLPWSFRSVGFLMAVKLCAFFLWWFAGVLWYTCLYSGRLAVHKKTHCVPAWWRRVFLWPATIRQQMALTGQCRSSKPANECWGFAYCVCCNTDNYTSPQLSPCITLCHMLSNGNKLIVTFKVDQQVKAVACDAGIQYRQQFYCMLLHFQSSSLLMYLRK